MNLWKSTAGIVEVELTSADIAGCISAISGDNIALYRVNLISELTARIQISRKDYKKLSYHCQKRGDYAKIIGRRGVYWTIKRLFMRPMLCAGVMLLFAATLSVPRYVLFVEVIGNENIPVNRILEAAASCGIGFGASREAVRSEHVKNALLSRIPELQWAGVNTRGCVAVISVREKTHSESQTPVHTVSSIVADRDGLIYRCTATRGTLLCAEGQAVREGETLISGYTDCGISIQATRAQGEVYACTNREITLIAPKECMQRQYETERRYSVSLIIEKKRINLWKDSGISDATCGRMYKEYYVTLPGGFRLPFALCIETKTCWKLTSGTMDMEETALEEFAEMYLSSQMVAGTILQKRESMETTDETYGINGSYVCLEMIGREKSEKMGDKNEQTD